MTKQKKYIIGISLIVIVEGVIAYFIKTDMSAISEPYAKLNTIFGMTIPFNGINITTVLNTWLIMAVVLGVSVFTTSHLTPVPGRLQAMIEMYVMAFENLCCEVLGKERGRRYLPLVATLFILVLLSNWIGIIPSFWQLFNGVFPHWLVIEEPTKDLNTTLGLGIMCFFIAHISGIYVKGVKSYLAEYFEPMVVIGKVRIPNLFMGVLNIVGEFGKTISHSFRLFGNILGGAIIILVISSLTKYIMLPVFLNAFFGLFVGAIQAFVFAMLALVYISVMVND